VVFAVGELIDADGTKALEPMGIGPVADNRIDDATDGAPSDTQQPGDGALVGDLGQLRCSP